MSQSIQFNSKSVRNSVNRSLCRRAFLLIPLLFVCLGFSSAAQAVTPPPDGGYGGSNTAEGTDALFSLTTGVWNSAFGFRSLYRNATGIRNTAVGYQALHNNNGLNSNHTGLDNVAVGASALFSNTLGSGNIAIGSLALYGNTTGSNNIAIGYRALSRNVNGDGNTVVGDSFESGADFVSVGREPVHDRGGGILVHGVLNTSINAENDVYVGSTVYYEPKNIYTSRVHILAEDAVYVGAVFGTAVTGSPVSIDSNGQLGVASSSKRFKDEIKPMDKASEAILSLKPVTFRYKEKLDPKGATQFGLVAEEVEKVNPDLVTCDAKGDVYTVRYEAVNAMLLNEFLKEHQQGRGTGSDRCKATVSLQRARGANSESEREVGSEQSCTADGRQQSVELPACVPSERSRMRAR